VNFVVTSLYYLFGQYLRHFLTLFIFGNIKIVSANLIISGIISGDIVFSSQKMRILKLIEVFVDLFSCGVPRSPRLPPVLETSLCMNVAAYGLFAHSNPC